MISMAIPGPCFLMMNVSGSVARSVRNVLTIASRPGPVHEHVGSPPGKAKSGHPFPGHHVVGRRMGHHIHQSHFTIPDHRQGMWIIDIEFIRGIHP